MSRSLTFLAWFNVVAHIIGLGFAALGMAPGTPLASLPERLQYLGSAPLGWVLGWSVWILCAVLLIAFLHTLVDRMGDNAGFARLGLMLAVAGAAFDVFCDSIYICVFPMLASMTPPNEQLFLTVEKITGIGSLVIANGAYSVGILLISADLWRQNKGVLIVWLGIAVGVFGLIMGAAGFTGSTQHAQWATPPTMIAFCFWVVLVARSFERNRRPA